jgi:hypothetical protein
MEDSDCQGFLLKLTNKSKGGLIKLKSSVNVFSRGKGADHGRGPNKDSIKWQSVNTIDNNRQVHNYSKPPNKR